MVDALGIAEFVTTLVTTFASSGAATGSPVVSRARDVVGRRGVPQCAPAKRMSRASWNFVTAVRW